MSRNPAQGTSGAARGYTLFMLAALTALNQFDRQLMNILIEPIRREFALSDVEIGLLSGFAFVGIYTVLTVPAALFAVRSHRVNLIAAAALTWGAMTALCGAAQSYAQFFVARFGVGIGEAGSMPPSHAIISDLYPPERRATAMAIWSAGINVGIFFAFLGGGVVGHRYGWRVAFFGAAALTVAFAIMLRLTVREPPRNASRATSVSLLVSTLRAMLRDRTLRHLWAAGILASTVSYAVLTWLPSFLVRSHHMTIASAGIYLALVIGPGGALGTWLGGYFSDRLGRRDARWSLWLVGAVIVASKPFIVAFLLLPATIPALVMFIVPAATAGVTLGPMLAVLHNRVAVELRPIASAIFLLGVNFVGLGLGPLVVGTMSDDLFAGFGGDALRYSLVAAQLLSLWAAYHYYVAGSLLSPTIVRPSPQS
ncbi:MAG TPA: MFS transporter [Pseudolabrys sp.]|nr:MFS transporter [Pseudolabrys sp.]